MLYLEDYLEIIEHLPQELRDRFTEMREFDLGVQNNVDLLERRQNNFFSECCRLATNNGDLPKNLEDEFKKLMGDYYKTLEDADEKVQIASHMYDLVERYLRRLDQELHKFKCELEADNSGITQVLEKRSLELDNQSPPNNLGVTQKENRYRPRDKRRESSNSSGSLDKRMASGQSNPMLSSTASMNSTASAVEIRHHLMSAVQNTPVTVPVTSALMRTQSEPNSSFNLNNMTGNNAIVAAASQAIAATQQMQQGRRTASLKASYEAIIPNHGHDLLIGRELAGVAQSTIQAIQDTTPKRQKKSTSSRKSSVYSSNSSNASQSGLVSEIKTEEASGDALMDDGEWTFDPNEPRYCVCNQVSYGDMVACDNEDCPFEWFHYPCVKITAPPKGKWYCPQCTSSMKRRGPRKN